MVHSSGPKWRRSIFVVLTVRVLLCSLLYPCLCFCLSFLLWERNLCFCFATVKKGMCGVSAESLSVRPLAGSLSMLMAVCGEGLPFIGPVGKKRKLCAEEEMERAEVLLGMVSRRACQWVVGGPKEEYDYVQYPEYAEKEEYYSWS